MAPRQVRAESCSGPVIQTSRLSLRMPQASDFDGFADFAADPDAMRYLGGVQPRSFAWRQMCTIAGSWFLYGYGPFSVVEKATNSWIGRVGPWVPIDWPGPELGWCFLPSAWGRGLATEAAAAALEWVRTELGWTRVMHSIAPDNAPSIRLAKRLGSSFLGPVRLPPPLDQSELEMWGQALAGPRSTSRPRAAARP